jgi:hypothetical protein
MGETGTIGTSLDFIPTRLALKGLKLVGAAIERMWRAPCHVHPPITRWANRSIMRTKPDLHIHVILAPSPIYIWAIR